MSSEQDIAIRIEGLGKKYILGETHQFTRTFRETLMDLPRVLGRKAKHGARRAARAVAPDPVNHTRPTRGREEFWALRDVNLEIKRGEAVGIIGRNGAGKSTLLKVLSRITAPTTGRAEIRGRVGALLEVGTGMNPELTGRENIFLNGSIIGMTKREIDAKFDEIVDFAGVEKFLDTPLKRYSSGMRVRLGFAVAAHLEPEILIVDEVLSVGDAEFQRKCLGKMDDVTQGGRTVLFVSHNMNAVESFCGRGILLLDGTTKADADTQSVISEYLSDQIIQNVRLSEVKNRSGSGALKFMDVRFYDNGSRLTTTPLACNAVTMELDYILAEKLHNSNVRIAVAIKDEFDVSVCLLGNDLVDDLYPKLPLKGTFRCTIPCLNLMPGIYQLNLFASANEIVADHLTRVFSFEVKANAESGFKKYPPRHYGNILMPHQWSVE